MFTELLRRAGLRGWHGHVASMGSVGLCIGLWIRAKTVDQEERGNAERRALFVGLWAPTLYLIGDSLERHEPTPWHARQRPLRVRRPLGAAPPGRHRHGGAPLRGRLDRGR